MRIAVAASLLKAISPESTGGTEAFAYILTEGLVQAGIDATLFATSDSVTSARLSSVVSSKQTTGVHEGPVEIRTAYELLQAKNIIKQSENFDIIHNNYWHFFFFTSFSSFSKIPIITTIHNNFWNYPNLRNILGSNHRKGTDTVVFLSKAAQQLAGDLVDSVVIPNGIDTKAYPFSPRAEDSILWLSRLTATKGIKSAIEAARMGNFSLTLSGVSPLRLEDTEYIAKNVTPYLTEKIQYIGPPGLEKISLYQKAKAFLFPTQVDEQFPLVVLEAMSCGTPIIAYNRGGVPEQIKDGVTGFIIDPDNEQRPGKGSWIIKKQGVEGLIEAVSRIGEIDRKACREHVEEYFTQEKMIEQYIALYNRLLQK